MKVGLVTTGFPRFEGDHSGAFLLSLARGLVSQGHRVVVLAPESPEACTLDWPGIEHRTVPYARPRDLQRTFYGAGAPDNLGMRPARWLGAASFSAALRIRAARELRDCDALVSSWCFPCGWVASEIAGARAHLCICHETDLRWLSRVPGGRALTRRIARGSTSMWFLSAGHRERFLALAGLESDAIRSHLGPMPIDPPRALSGGRDALRRELGIERFTLLFLGRLVPLKGVDQLLHAAARLRTPAHVRIAGDGPARKELETLAKELGVDAHFEGWVSGEHKESLLVASDALVAPSRPGDGLPTVLFEAQARGLPLVTTRVGAIPSRLTESPQAQLVPPDDIGALRDAIDTLAEASALRA